MTTTTTQRTCADLTEFVAFYGVRIEAPQGISTTWSASCRINNGHGAAPGRDRSTALRNLAELVGVKIENA